MIDLEIFETEDGWEVWTPDRNGACIGGGNTEREAKEDAVRNMEEACAELCGKTTHRERREPLGESAGSPAGKGQP